MATISVIIPAYNCEKTILATVESVQKQNFSDFEIIVINDGSTDKTLERLDSITDKRVKIFSYQNAGVCAARNRGIFHAKGDYIAFVDADDLWTPDKLKLQLAALKENPEAGVAYSWTYYFMDGQEDVLFPGNQVYYTGNVYAQLLVNNFLANGSNPLIRKKAIESVGEFDPACTPCEDWDLYLRLAGRWSFVVVPKHQILYRQSSSSASSNLNAIEKGGLTTIEKAYQIAPLELQYLKNQSLAWLYEYCTQQYLKQATDINRTNQAGQKLWQAIRLHPPILLEEYAHNLIVSYFKKLIKNLILALLPPRLVGSFKFSR